MKRHYEKLFVDQYFIEVETGFLSASIMEDPHDVESCSQEVEGTYVFDAKSTAWE